MKCRGCGAEIIWIKMYGSGKQMPVDAEPVRVLYGEGEEKFIKPEGIVILGRQIGDAWDDNPEKTVMEAYVSHFATCPKSGQFRGKRRQA